jgi:hypothetical protein
MYQIKEGAMPMLPNQEISPKSGLTTFIICMFFGALGIHRFYVGKIGTGILMLLTFGGLGFWILYDLFSIVCKSFTDSEGRTVEIARNPTAPRNVVITVACIYFIIFGTVFMVTGKAMREVMTVGKSELSALRAGNVEEAYSYTSSAFQKGVSLDTFKSFVASYPALHDNVDSTFSDVEYKDGDGLIKGALNMKDGSAVPVTMDLVKENDQWKVNEINVRKSDVQTVSPTPIAPAAPAPTPVTSDQAPANPPAQSSDQAPAVANAPTKSTDQAPATAPAPAPAPAPAQSTDQAPANASQSDSSDATDQSDSKSDQQ